ncbi:hypothetical protein GS596_18455, partial [Escherichia coli]|nr:hypothetical protein [Escherichia coli]
SEKSHGREEIRLHIVCDVPDELIDFTFEWKGKPWTESIWRQSLRGARFRNLALLAD